MARKYRARALPLIAVVVGLEGAFWCNPDIGRLVIAKPGQFDPSFSRWRLATFSSRCFGST